VTAGVVATVFVLVAVAELPDKTMIATLVMGSRSAPLYVWLGAAGAFLVHVSLAVGAGRAIELLPHKALEIVVTALFFLGAVLLLVIPEWREQRRGEAEADRAKPADTTSFGAWKVAATAFGVILVGEFGDLTQILTLNLVAKYHEPWSVFVGAYAGLLATSAIAAFGGRALLRWVPLEWIRRAGGVALLGFAAYGVYGLVA
jgi:Ca2+/H+ antiporter, TMEM165/GDT1 family